jgi:beta-aspartyl-peptidase (threonine type)
MTQVTPTIVVHGGAGNIPDELAEAFVAGCHRAVELGLAVLAQGGAAEDAVEAAIRYLEDDEAFDAGRGSFLNMDGVVELDAAMMEGATLQIGAVAGLHDIANPITLARHVMASPHVFIIGEGASRFAVECGMAPCGPERLWTAREQAVWERYRREAEVKAPVLGDTVGAVAWTPAATWWPGSPPVGSPTSGRARGRRALRRRGLLPDDSVGAAVSTATASRSSAC